MEDGPPPHIETVMLGDVVISVDAALRESEVLGEPLDDTIDRLLIHGLLHLLGYDHENSRADETRMQEEEKRLLNLIRETLRNGSFSG
jgi:rRNA maturation RNase YbeY